MRAARLRRVFAGLSAGSLACLLVLPSCPASVAQTRKPAAAADAPCDEQRALALIRQQAEDAKSFEPSAGQLGVLVKAGDLLWTRDEEAARALFAVAFDLATKYYRERGEETRHEGKLQISMPDQRFIVLRTIGKRDGAWARRLAEQSAADAARDAEGVKPMPASESREVGGKLASLAFDLLDVDRQTALAIARASLRHPAAISHPILLYKLAETDRAAADQLFREALAAYSATGTTEDLSYLAVYAYGLHQPPARVRAWTYFNPPPGYRPDPALTEGLTRAVLARAEVVLRTPDQFAADRDPNAWETTQIYTALVELERRAQESAPALRERLAETRARAEAAFGDRARRAAEGFMRPGGDDPGRLDHFDRMIESVERATTPERRDAEIAFTAPTAKTVEQLARVEQLTEKVSDPNVRRQLLNWLNFTRAQQLAKDGQFDEARRAADRVDELDLRSVLYFEIARESIKRLEDKARAGELLAAVAAAARSAPNTSVKARAQLGVAHLYADFDSLRALEVLAEAVKTVNTLEGDPDLLRSHIPRRIEGKTFGTYSVFNVPGFSLENSFREAGARDFDGALLAARGLSDRVLRAAATIGLASRCLEQPAPRQQPPPPKKPVAGPRPEGRAKP